MSVRGKEETVAKLSNKDLWTTEQGLLRIQGWARDGLTCADIAHNIGINRCTLTEWKKKDARIAFALQEGKDVADRRVENALYKRAIGYDIEEQKIIDDGKTRRVETVKKHIPGDVTAQIYWLKNRKPDEWRDKRETSVSADIEDLSPLVELLK